MHKYLVEFLGAFFLVLTVVMTTNHPDYGALAPLAVGSAYAVMIYAGAGISGGHYNPAISLAVFMWRRLSLTDLFYYVVAQLAGAVIAALIAIFLLNCGAAPRIDPVVQTSAVCSIVAEMLGTLALAFVFLRVVETERPAERPPAYGFAVGFALFAMLLALGPVSGGAFNPAVALGLCISGNFHFEDSWIFLVGPGLGAAAGATMYQLTARQA